MLPANVLGDCKRYADSYDEFGKYNSVARKLGWICGLSLLGIIISILQQPPFLTKYGVHYVLLVVFVIAFGMGLVYSRKAKPYKLDTMKVLILSCYNAYGYLEDYKKSGVKKSLLSDAKKELKDMVDIMSLGWTTLKEREYLTFNEYAKPVFDLAQNIKDKLAPAITNDDSDSINKNMAMLEELINFFYQKQFDFASMNSKFSQYESMKKEISVQKIIQNKYIKNGLLLAAFIGVGGLVFLIVGLAGASRDSQIQDWVFVSGTLGGVYYAAVRKKGG